ncbi:MAG: hypothetical protein R2710_19740 [Acidimicrobiales bacterium]
MRRPKTSSFRADHRRPWLPPPCSTRRCPEGAPWWSMALVVATSRIHTRMHHASDVVAGAVIGRVIGAPGRHRFRSFSRHRRDQPVASPGGDPFSPSILREPTTSDIVARRPTPKTLVCVARSTLDVGALPLWLARLHRALPVDATVRVTMRGDLPVAKDVLIEGAGFSTDADKLVRERTLPDMLSPGLRAVMVGLNPSVRSADAGYGLADPETVGTLRSRPDSSPRFASRNRR